MARRRGGGCAVVLLILFVLVLLGLAYKFVLPWYRKQPPPASGKELQVHILDVGPGDGDSILIIAPEGNVALIDAGDFGRGKVVIEALKRYDVKQIDLFVATHAHTDHIGGAPEVLRAFQVSTVLDNGFPPPEAIEAPSPKQPKTSGKGKTAAGRPSVNRFELPTVRAYNDFKSAVDQSGAEFKRAEPGQVYDLGGGARLSMLAPIQPFFTREQMRAGGNEPNANSIVLRLDYGEFSMLLAGDAEVQTEERMMEKGAGITAKILKVAHHGSKYATSEEFIKRVKPEVAIISDGEYNRYGHPSKAVLDRLRAAGIQLYRTDLEGEISVTTKGKTYEVKSAKEPKSDVWEGREAQKDDSSRSGFISYGDFGPPPRTPARKSSAPKK